MIRHVLHSRAAAAAGLMPPRCTGRSTAQAFIAIGAAMRNPGQKVPLRDHHGTYRSNDWLMRLCQDIVHRMDYKGFVFNRAEYTITWEPYQEVGDDE